MLQVGRERLSALCLMQKFADLFSLGTVLKIKSAFAVDHMKGFVYIEAERQCDINEVISVLGIFVWFNFIARHGFKLRSQQVFYSLSRNLQTNVAEILSSTISFQVKHFYHGLILFPFVINSWFQACQGIPGIYVTRVALVPNSEVYHLFSVRNRTPEISEGMWARIKGGNYKGDLAQVPAKIMFFVLFCHSTCGMLVPSIYYGFCRWWL